MLTRRLLPVHAMTPPVQVILAVTVAARRSPRNLASLLFADRRDQGAPLVFIYFHSNRGKGAQMPTSWATV